jgi:branched-subunit amino acid transport protein
MVSVITVPVLIGLGIIACVFHVRRQNLGQARRTLLLFHATALVVALVAEIVFMSASRSGGHLANAAAFSAS